MPSGIYKRTEFHRRIFLENVVPFEKGKPPFPHKKNCKCCRCTKNPPTKSFKKGMIPWNKGKTLPQFSGKNHPNWKGGTQDRGYWFIYKPNHLKSLRNGYVKRCILVMEKMLGRPLKPKEVVHHINGIRNDDRKKNLQLFSDNGKHMKYSKHKNSLFVKSQNK